jgi:hypothetical protein
MKSLKYKIIDHRCILDIAIAYDVSKLVDNKTSDKVLDKILDTKQNIFWRIIDEVTKT